MSGVNKTDWWIFYPLKGLRITDKLHSLDHPLFGDATIISRQHIKDIVALLKLNETMVKGHDHEGSVTYFFENLAFDEEFESFIAVKRSGPSRIQTKKQSHIKEIIDLADKRSRQIASLLQLAFLCSGKEWRTCALVDQIRKSQNKRAVVAPEISGFAMQFASRSALTCVQPFTTNRRQLLAMLRKNCIRYLSSILLPQKSALNPSLQRHVFQAAIRLSDSLHDASIAGQLLGAVTSMEILLTEQDGFDVLERRIARLVGLREFEFFGGKQLLKDRHLYVHQGIEPIQDNLRKSSSALALLCLLRFAELTHCFDSKPDILAYLDFLCVGEKLHPKLTRQEQILLKRLTKKRDLSLRFSHFAAMP